VSSERVEQASQPEPQTTEDQEYLAKINTEPSTAEDLREVARVVFPANKDLDALPLYIDGPINRDGPSSAGADTANQHPDDIISRRSVRIRAGPRV